jgi:DNA invertase Pin-like site-specific DNA recombinase
LREDETIDGIVVKSFSRLGRDPLDQASIKRDLERYEVGREVEVLQVEPWNKPYRAIPDGRTEALKKKENPMEAWNRYQLFMMQASYDQMELLQVSKRTKAGLQSKKERDEHVGNPPWGITTDKVFYEDVTESKNRLPGDNFGIAIEILNKQATVGDPNDYGSAEGLWSYAKGKGMGSPSSTIKRMWNNRDDYRKALQNARNPDFANDFDVDDIQMDF